MTTTDPAGTASALLFEHINLNVPDVELARAFYVRGLGGQENPVGTNARQLHINMGSSQLHLPFRASIANNEPVEVAQVWPGEVMLWTNEALEAVRARLADVCPSAAPHFRGTDNGELCCICPWGNRFVLQRAPTGYSVAGEHAGGSAGLVAMPLVTMPIPTGRAEAIARFYSLILGCSARLVGNGCCEVGFNGQQTLRFEEIEDAPPVDAYDHNEAAASHICIYLESDAAFTAAFERANAANLLFVNPRFEGGPPEFASAASWEEATACGQFRLKDMVDVSNGSLGLVLEHEVRTPSHKSCPLKARR